LLILQLLVKFSDGACPANDFASLEALIKTVSSAETLGYYVNNVAIRRRTATSDTAATVVDIAFTGCQRSELGVDTLSFSAPDSTLLEQHSGTDDVFDDFVTEGVIKFTAIHQLPPCGWNSGCAVSELETLELTSENPYVDDLDTSAIFAFSYEGVNAVGISFMSDPAFADTGDVLTFLSPNDTTARRSSKFSCLSPLISQFCHWHPVI